MHRAIAVAAAVLMAGLTLTLGRAQAQRASQPGGAERSGQPAPIQPSASQPSSGPIQTTPTAPVPTTAPVGTRLPGGAVLFGVQTVGFLRDLDVIQVGANLGQFDRIQLRVLDNDIFLRAIDVVYADGSSQRLAIESDVKQNTRTRWLDVTGTKFIKEIKFSYRSRPSFKGKARVEVYGQLAEGWLGPNGRGRQFNEGWVLLGAQTAGRFVRPEVDTIPVGRNEGLFKRLRFTVKDRGLVLDELRVVYGSGEEEVISSRSVIEANRTIGPFDLKGGNRVIREIRLRYRSVILDRRARPTRPAVVEIWGQH